MAMDLERVDPIWLAESAPLDDLYQAVRGTERWSEQAASVLDTVYRFRLIRALMRHDESEEAKLLALHLGRVTSDLFVPRLNALERPYAARWDAYADVLQDYLEARAMPMPLELAELEHVAKVREVLAAQNSLSLDDLARAVGAEKDELIDLVAQLERWDVVWRRWERGEERVVLGDRARELFQDEGRQPERSASRDCSQCTLWQDDVNSQAARSQSNRQTSKAEDLFRWSIKYSVVEVGLSDPSRVRNPLSHRQTLVAP